MSIRNILSVCGLSFLLHFVTINAQADFEIGGKAFNVSETALKIHQNAEYCGKNIIAGVLDLFSSNVSPNSEGCFVCHESEYLSSNPQYSTTKWCPSMMNDVSNCTQVYQVETEVVSQLKEVSQFLSTVSHSCQEILDKYPTALSGNYVIQLLNGSFSEVYCNMDATHCGPGGWTRVAYADMTKLSSCPKGLSTYLFDGFAYHLCDREHVPYGGCDSAYFTNYDISYRQVCGRLRGFQYGQVDGIYPNHNNVLDDIDSPYVDGVSITYDSSPRKHIWTYIVGQEEFQSLYENCPCNSGSIETTPSYVGNDYYCESGQNVGRPSPLYYTDYLWDGKTCFDNEATCCNDDMPWFSKTLSSSTTSDVELRMCTSEGYPDEATPLDIIELYIR